MNGHKNERFPLFLHLLWLSIFRDVFPFLTVGYSSHSSRIIHLAAHQAFSEYYKLHLLICFLARPKRRRTASVLQRPRYRRARGTLIPNPIDLMINNARHS